MFTEFTPESYLLYIQPFVCVSVNLIRVYPVLLRFTQGFTNVLIEPELFEHAYTCSLNLHLKDHLHCLVEKYCCRIDHLLGNILS